nr:immunoglobulin light chain junction region [Macaca mulatta]
RMIWHNYAYIF